MSELDKLKTKIFLGLKRKPVQIFSLEDIQAMEQKTNDEYENSETDMMLEDGDFFKTIVNQSLFIHIGNGQYILDYEKIEKNSNLILPYMNTDNNNDMFDKWSYTDFRKYFKDTDSKYYESQSQ